MSTTHEFRVEEPPASARGAQHGPVLDNLRRAADVAGQWTRVATYASRSSATSVAHDLRSGRKGKRRPPGTWEFKSGPVDNTDRFGVWARFTPLP